MEKQPTRKRPFGVLVLILLQIGSILGVALDITVVQIGQPSIYFGPVENLNLLLGFQILYILYSLVVVVGLWQLRRWAWFIIMVQLGLSMALGLGLYFLDNPFYLGMVVNVIMVFYLNQREVQQAFERRRRSQETAP
jgi:uncharacterized membrane protein (DUF2068 family)